MASLTKRNGKRGTAWRIEFFLGDRTKRKCIRLGVMQKRSAETVKARIELLIAAKASGVAPDPELARWAAERDDNLHQKMAQHGLVAPRLTRLVPSLADFADRYIAGRL